MVFQMRFWIGNYRRCRVAVPLRRRKVQGTVIQVSPVEGQEGFALRPLASLLHPKTSCSALIARTGELDVRILRLPS